MIPALIEIILAIILGIITGTFSGITPGIHINMISLIILNISPYLSAKLGISMISLCVFIIVVGITHTFLDALPSIFLGAPDDSTALGILPGHRYLLSGHGMIAVKLFTIGSLLGLIVGIVLFPVLYLFTKHTYSFFERYFALILIVSSSFMILRDNKIFWSLFVFALSSALGIAVFSLHLKDPLFPLLSGLFGVSTLLISLKDNNNIPIQKITPDTDIEHKKTFLCLIAGNISGFIVSTFPGLSSSIAAVISIQFFKNIGDKGFLILLGCIGTSSFILSLVALYTVDKARNGAVIVISKLAENLTIDMIILFLICSLIAGAISAVLALRIGKFFAHAITLINYKALVIAVIVFVTVLVFVMTSWKGLLVLMTSTALGIIPGIVKVQRTHSMACLIVPTIIYLL